MDAFVNSLNSQSVHLDGLDAICSTAQISFFYWYENKERSTWGTFMPPDILKHAFYRTMQEFPILAGRLKAGPDGRMLVEVDKDNLNMPVYTDEYCNIDYQALKDANYNTVNMLPDIFMSARKVPMPSKASGWETKLATVRILRFKDFSGVLVFVSLAHGVVDGHGQLSFMKRWSEISRAIHGADGPTVTNIPNRPYTHDRSIHALYKCEGTDEVDPEICNGLQTPSLFSRCLAWLSPSMRARLISFVASEDTLKSCYFRIRKQTIETLRQSVQDHAYDSSIRYSHNDIISALITTAIVQATRKHSVKQERTFVPSVLRSIFGPRHTKEPENVMLSVVVDLRPRIDNHESKYFTGNLIIIRDVVVPLEFVETGVTPKSLAAVASGIHQAVAGMSRRCIGQHYTLLNNSADSFIRAMLYCNKFKYRQMVSNHTRFRHYSVDFGTGIPDLIRPGTLAFPNSTLIMPEHPETNTYEISMALTRPVRENIVQDKNWMQFVEKYSFDM
ncbi:hypothetical protein LPJ59_000230 [Coemansia sp. RSA 2399]|nr:hypothetical protein LPJ59_000230 [Coemansia sp. RSA 2399]KAJ1908283.1 hypothetical protein LPJ81_000194 [Coemansia sp. IMI 209127]